MSVRADGRTAHQLRALASESRALNRADGSARFAFGGSAALCGVHGPLACASTRDELPDRALLDVQCAPPTGRVGYVASAFISRLAARDRSDVTAQSSVVFLCIYVCTNLFKRNFVLFAFIVLSGVAFQLPRISHRFSFVVVVISILIMITIHTIA